MEQEITVSIATTAEAKREQQLERAIDSVLSQQGCSFKLHLIINGDRFDRDLKEKLEQDQRFSCFYREEGHLPKALAYARSIIDTDYFCFLDDDDELLPDSLCRRLNGFDVNTDVVVGNGVRRNTNTGEESISHPNFSRYQLDPLLSLFGRSGTWLSSCAGLFKTSSIPTDYFSDYIKYAEWSYLAFKVALKHNVGFVDHECHRVNIQSGSLSSHDAYLEGQMALLEALKGMSLPSRVSKLFSTKLTDTYHVLSVNYLKQGEKTKSWQTHLSSMRSLEGFKKYILYTRHVIIGSLK
ncbi:glycosyltransferase family A protein [Colwelliaceae bacterium 6441]